MATEFETALTDPSFTSRRIDELLASAIEDQARDQRMMIETVTAARKALAAAQADLSALRTLVESRDQGVVDMLEARLAGIATQEAIEAVVRRLDPVEHAASELAERLDRIVAPLDGVRSAIGSLTESMNSLREQSRQEFGLWVDRFDQFESRTQDMLESQEHVISGQMTLSQNSLAERLEGQLESFRTQQTEILEAAIGELRGMTEDILRGFADTVRQEMRDELQRLSANTFGHIQKLRDDIAGYEKVISDLPMLVDEHLVGHREASKASDAAMSRQLEQMRKGLTESAVDIATRFEKIERDYSGRLSEMKNEFSGSIDDLAADLTSRFETLTQTAAAQGPAVAEVVGSVLQPFVDEMSRLSERGRQMNRRLTESNSRLEAMHESMMAYLSQRDEAAEKTRDGVLAELIEHMASALGHKDRMRLTEAFREADQRRKDRRDAERYRKLKGKSEVVPETPPAVEEIDLTESPQKESAEPEKKERPRRPQAKKSGTAKTKPK